MKISKTQLTQIIKEELEAVLSEEGIDEKFLGYKKFSDVFKYRPDFSRKKKKAAPAEEPEEDLSDLPRWELVKREEIPWSQLSNIEIGQIPYAELSRMAYDGFVGAKAELAKRDKRRAKEADIDREVQRRRGVRQQQYQDTQAARFSPGKKKSGSFSYRGAHGRSGEGSPSAPWDE